MLILSRGEDEAIVIVIGDDVEITVLSVKGKTVKIGINAPSNVAVHRSEVYVKVQRENCDEQRICGNS